jgi:hypothetical protein
MHRIKNIKNLVRLPSGNFRDSLTGVVYAKTPIEKLLSEKAAEKEPVKEVEKEVVNESSEKPTQPEAPKEPKAKKAKSEKAE